MNDEKKYKEALEKLQDALAPTKDGCKISGLTRNCIEEIFPELKESDDKRIIKCLLNYFHHVRYNGLDLKGTDVDEVIVWLEKQDNTNETIDRDKFAQNVLRGAAINLITWIDYNASEGNMCLSNMECKDIEDALVSGNWNKIYAYIKKKLEKQDEKPQGKTALEAINEEKIDNSNKVEPKFHEGDFIVDNCGNVWKIEGIVNQFYILEDVEGCESLPTIEWVDKTFHLWTIADAENGDVLVASDESIFIYNGSTDRHAKFYVALTKYGQINVEGGNWEEKNSVHPSTKEQRDLLFQKMEEACYEWDEEKKELNKVKPKFKVGDWIIFNNKHESVYQIEKIENFQYTLRHISGGSMPLSFSNEGMIRHWTIKDAKEGDVLVHNNCTFIFTGVKNGIVQALEENLLNGTNPVLFGEYDKDEYYPATKEQRDALFAKMREAGYEWDDE